MSTHDDNITDDEIRQVIDSEAMRRHQMSGERFIELVQAGDIDEECGRSADLVGLVRLLPEGRATLVR